MRVLAILIHATLTPPENSVAADFETLKIDKRLQREFGIIAASEEYQSETFRISAHGGNITDPFVVARVGGVIFVEEAQPHWTLTHNCPTFSYDPDARNGRRIVIEFKGLPAVTTKLVDWELGPLLAYVESGDHAVVSLMNPIEIDGERALQVEIQPDLKDTLVGFNLLLVDSIRRITKFPKLTLLFHDYEIPGYNLYYTWDFLWRSHDAQEIVKDVISRLDGDQIMYTDKDQNFFFSIADGSFEISGEPYYLVMETQPDGIGKIVFQTNWIDSMGDDLRRANRMVFESAVRAVKYIAFFRYLRNRCKDSWRDLKNLYFSNPGIEEYILLTPAAVMIEID